MELNNYMLVEIGHLVEVKPFDCVAYLDRGITEVIYGKQECKDGAN